MSEEESKLAVDEAEKAVEQWKVRKLISTLEAARGNGTSMISLIIPPKDQISRVTKMLGDELGTATHIKSRVNRLSVLGAITSVQQKLKLYNRVPPNGLVVYSGSVITLEGKEKKINIDFEPFKPINTSLYLCIDGDAAVQTLNGPRRLRDIVDAREAVSVYGLSAKSALNIQARTSAADVTLDTAAVTHVATRGLRPCVGVLLSDGRELICTPDHRILISRNGQVQWAQAANTLRGDFALCAPNAPVDDSMKQQMLLDDDRLYRCQHVAQDFAVQNFLVDNPLRSAEARQLDREQTVAPSSSTSDISDEQASVMSLSVSRSIEGKDVHSSGVNELLNSHRSDRELQPKPLSAVSIPIISVYDVGDRAVFDLSVDGLHSFTANGVIVHNCDNKFHTEALNELLESDEKFGFIVMDGMGTLFGVLSGNTRTILHKFTVDLPKKHGRGGQSALRFARLRLEKRHNYLRKVAETAVQMFITNDRPNVSGLILAGSAEFKTKLNASDLFDPRLQTIVQKIVDVSYGGENGFNQAIELAADCLLNVKFIREKKLLSNYFSEIAKDSGRYCFCQSDARILTDAGFLFLEQIEARIAAGERVMYGCYDTRTKALHYAFGQVVFPRNTNARLLTFNSSGEAHRWTSESGEYGKAFVDDVHLSLRVTDNHRMFVQSGCEVDNGSFKWRTMRRDDEGNAVRGPSVVVPASALLSRCSCSTDSKCAHRRAAVRMLACAESGYAPLTDATERIRCKLALDAQQFQHFLYVLGAWMADGSLEPSRGVGAGKGLITFADSTASARQWLRHELLNVGVADDLTVQNEFASERDVVAVRNDRWFTFFDEEFGSSAYKKSSSPDATKKTVSKCKSFPAWAVWQLEPEQLERIVEGFRRTDGGSDGATKFISTSNVGFRDDLLQVLLHCGFSPHAQVAHNAGAIRAYTRCDENGLSRRVSFDFFQSLSADEKRQYSPITASVDCWKVSWCAPTNRSGRAACLPSLLCDDGISESQYNQANDGRQWCVQVDHPDHLIIAQRAQRHGGHVTKQSRPVVVGNCFGVKDTLAALDLGAVEELIVWESLDINRLLLKNKELNSERVVYWTERQEKEPAALKEADGTELEVIDKVTLLEWLANNFKSFGAKLQFVTNKSQEGSQFVKGFGGIGGLLRYQVDFLTMEVVEEDEDDFM